MAQYAHTQRRTHAGYQSQAQQAGYMADRLAPFSTNNSTSSGASTTPTGVTSATPGSSFITASTAYNRKQNIPTASSSNFAQQAASLLANYATGNAAPAVRTPISPRNSLSQVGVGTAAGGNTSLTGVSSLAQQQGKSLEAEYIQGLEQQIALLDLETQYIYQQFSLGQRDAELESSLVRHMKALREKCAAAVQAHRHQRESMETQVEDAKRRCIYMEKIIVQLKQDVADANGKQHDQEIQFSEGKTKVIADSVRVQKQLEQSQLEVRRLQQDKDQTALATKELRTSANEKDQTIAQLSLQLEAADKDKREALEQVSSWQQRCTQQSQQLEVLQAAPPEDLRVALETLQSQKQEAEVLVQQKLLALTQAEQARDQAVAQCHAAMQREAQQLSSIKKLQNDLNKEMQKSATLQRQLHEAQQRADDALELQRSLDDATRQLQLVSGQLEQARKKVAAYMAEMKRLDEDRAGLQGEVARKDQHLRSVEDANTDLRAQLQQTADALARSEAQAQQMRGHIETLRDKIQHADAHAEVMQKKWALAQEVDQRLNSHELLALKDSAAQITATLDNLTKKFNGAGAAVVRRGYGRHTERHASAGDAAFARPGTRPTTVQAHF
eukprot:TRINITY_DN518_c0_g2_i4.p1 TRINITY_DN518_c0_g2~~TRINITY_DN518_c0_g2_i4.p1  ORF type:complete len:639 (-),score=184.25 TRINITY_DN518_c0_g2_i4:263-2104(-)